MGEVARKSKAREGITVVMQMAVLDGASNSSQKDLLTNWVCWVRE